MVNRDYDLMPLKAASKEVGVSYMCVYHAARQHEIPSSQIGRARFMTKADITAAKEYFAKKAKVE